MKRNVEETMNQEQNEIIKKDNKKAGIKFAIIMLCCVLLGMVAGILSVKVSKGFADIPGRFNQFMINYVLVMGIIYSIVMVILTVLTMVWSIYNTQYVKKNAERLLGNDCDTEFTKIDKKLSFGVCITNALIVLQFIYFSIMVMMNVKFMEQNNFTLIPIAIIIFVTGMLVAVLLQQKVVDCVRLMNPEKKGSVYDFNFRRKWEDSSDEAELFATYKAAYMSFKVVNMLCIILWMIFLMIGLATGAGFIPVITVLIIWATSISVYSYYSIKISN